MPFRPEQKSPLRLLALCVAASVLHPAGARAQPGPEHAYRTATGLLNRGLEDLAAEEYRSFLRSNPSHQLAPSARYGLAVCLVRLGKHSDAIVELDRLTGSDGFEFAADVLVLQGECCFALGRFDAAGDWFDRAVKDHPQQNRLDFVLARLGEARYRAAQFDKASTALERVVERWPQSASRERCEYLLALCDVAEGKEQSAAKRLAGVRARFPEGACLAQATLVEAQCRHRLGESDQAIALYRSASQLPDAAVRPDALLGLAQLTRAAGEPAEARRLLDQLVRDFPKFFGANAAALERSRALFDEERFDEALRGFQSVQGSGGAEASAATLWAARCLIRLSRPGEAASALARVIAQSPERELLPDLLFEQALAQSQAGRDSEAANTYERLLDEFASSPRAADALLARAGALHRLEQFKESLFAAERFTADHPRHSRAGDALLLIAENQYFLVRYEQAERSYSQFLRQNEDGAQVWRATVRRGLCLVRLDRDAEAQRILTQAVAHTPPPDEALARSAHAALGDLAFDRGDWQESEQWFRRLIDADRAAADEGAALRLGLSVHRQGRPADALQIYEPLIKRAQNPAIALQADFERGQALVELNRLDEARQAFESVIARTGDSPDSEFHAAALRHLASIASRQGKPEAAAALLGQLARSSTGGAGSSDALLDRGIMLIASGDYDAAEDALSAFLDQASDDSRAGEARAYLAVTTSRLGRADEALAQFKLLERELPRLQSQVRDLVLYETAWTLQRLERESDARAAYQRLLADDPSPAIESNAAVELAQLELNAGSFEQALNLLDRAERAAAGVEPAGQSSVLANVLFLRGACLVRLERHSDAAKALEAFLTRHSDSASAASAGLLLGEALLHTGRPDQAARSIQNVVDQGPDEATLSVALLRLGDAAAAAQDWAASERAFAEYLRRFHSGEHWFQAQFGIGWARENSGNPDHAIDAYTKVVERHQGPTAARAQFQIGECHFASKRLDAAVRELLKVDILFAVPEWSAAALYEAGRCLRELQREAEARRQFQQVIDRYPDTQWASLATELMAATHPAPLPGADTRGRTAASAGSDSSR